MNIVITSDDWDYVGERFSETVDVIVHGNESIVIIEYTTNLDVKVFAVYSSIHNILLECFRD